MRPWISSRVHFRLLCQSYTVTKKLLFYLVIYGCTGSLILCSDFLKLWPAEATLPCSAWASHCGGFSCCGADSGHKDFSSFSWWAVEHRLSYYGAEAYLLYGMCNLPGLGIEPTSPALAGGLCYPLSHKRSPRSLHFNHMLV